MTAHELTIEHARDKDSVGLAAWLVTIDCSCGEFRAEGSAPRKSYNQRSAFIAICGHAPEHFGMTKEQGEIARTLAQEGTPLAKAERLARMLASGSAND